MSYWFFYFLMKFLDFIYFKTRYVGLENLPQEKGFILASNHISNLDPFVLGIIQKRRFSFLAKEELFNKRMTRWLFRSMGAFPIKRDGSDLGALKEALRRLKSLSPLILFPEGTRGVGDRKKKPQAGIGFLAIKSGMPVIPAFIKGSDKALPNGAKWFRRHDVIVTLGKPLYFDKTISYQEISNKIMSKILEIPSGK